MLIPFRPVEAYADQIRMVRECKLREEQLSIQEKDRKEKKKNNKKRRQRREN